MRSGGGGTKVAVSIRVPRAPMKFLVGAEGAGVLVAAANAVHQFLVQFSDEPLR